MPLGVVFQDLAGLLYHIKSIFRPEKSWKMRSNTFGAYPTFYLKPIDNITSKYYQKTSSWKIMISFVLSHEGWNVADTSKFPDSQNIQFVYIHVTDLLLNLGTPDSGVLGHTGALIYADDTVLCAADWDPIGSNNKCQSLQAYGLLLSK